MLFFRTVEKSRLAEPTFVLDGSVNRAVMISRDVARLTPFIFELPMGNGCRHALDPNRRTQHGDCFVAPGVGIRMQGLRRDRPARWCGREQDTDCQGEPATSTNSTENVHARKFHCVIAFQELNNLMEKLISSNRNKSCAGCNESCQLAVPSPSSLEKMSVAYEVSVSRGGV